MAKEQHRSAARFLRTGIYVVLKVQFGGNPGPIYDIWFGLWAQDRL